MTNAHGVVRDQLRAFIERIERLEEEKKTIADDIKDVYAEAKGMGFIPAMMKKVIALRKKDEQERMEEEAILDTYLLALGMIAQPDLFEEPHHPETGEIIDPKLAQTIVTGMQTEIGRKALIAAVDIMIASEEAEEQNAPERPSHNDEPSPGPQAEASPAGTGAGMLADREGRHDGEAAPVDLPTRSDDDAIAAVKSKARLANVVDVEPSSSAPIDPTEDREGDQSLGGVNPDGETRSPDANAGGGHVDVSKSAAQQQAVAIVQAATATKPLRPHCRTPGEHCGGYGSNHCHSCLRASKEAEVAA